MESSYFENINDSFSPMRSAILNEDSLYFQKWIDFLLIFLFGWVLFLILFKKLK